MGGLGGRAYMSRYCYLRLCLLRYGISEYHWDMGTGGGNQGLDRSGRTVQQQRRGYVGGIWNGRRFFFFPLAPRSSMPS